MSESARIEVRGGDDWVTRNKMDRFIATIELIAAFFIGLVAIDIFLTVMLRNFFAMALPDSYDIGQLLLGILIFWGIAATRSTTSMRVGWLAMTRIGRSRSRSRPIQVTRINPVTAMYQANSLKAW